MIKWSKVLIMGLTYTNNIADTRESPVSGIVADSHSRRRGLRRDGVDKPLVPYKQVKEK